MLSSVCEMHAEVVLAKYQCAEVLECCLIHWL